ncbi:MAG TPA: Gfo/Idh/MocA family oxidoreductase [Actinomycetota bacterium]|nr:Gfo/Idh/MocA family oxidoreductase [Actinomycetota bacterium]
MSDARAVGRPRTRVGIVGAGFAASSHLDALSRVGGVEVTAIAASTPERGRAAAERYGIERAREDWRAVVEDDEVDVVHNCTPNFLHAEVSSAALSAGKHVLSEKPLAMDSRETAALRDHAASTQAVTGVCFNYRHYPLVQHARAMLSSGDEGDVHLVRGTYLQDWLLLEDDWNWRLETSKAGTARAMGDIGSHWLDLVQHVTGDRVEAVMADLGTLHTERLRPAGEVETFARAEGEKERVAVGTDDFGSVLLRFSGGASGVFTVSQVSAGRKNHLTFEIDTARASLSWNQEEPNTLRIGRRDAPSSELPRDPSLLAPEAAALARYPGGHQEGWPDALRNLLEDFYAAVAAHRGGREHRSTFATFDEAHGITLVVEAIAESHRSRAWVDVAARPAIGTS